MNPYDILGVSQDASDDDIAKAYKQLAKKYHPDLHPNDASAVRKMGEINRAYDDVKAMRQRGETYGTEDFGNTQSAYNDPFYTVWRTYTTRTNYNYTPPRRNPVSGIIFVMVMILLVRFFLSVLFGGFGGSYYVNSRGMPRAATVIPGYGYYDVTP